MVFKMLHKILKNLYIITLVHILARRTGQPLVYIYIYKYILLREIGLYDKEKNA